MLSSFVIFVLLCVGTEICAMFFPRAASKITTIAQPNWIEHYWLMFKKLFYFWLFIQRIKSTTYNYMFIAAFTVVKIWKHSHIYVCICVCVCVCVCVCIHTHNRILLLHSAIQWWNLGICNSVDRTWGYHVKWNKSDREKQTLYNFTPMWNIKNFKNKWINQTKANTQIQRTN